MPIAPSSQTTAFWVSSTWSIREHLPLAQEGMWAYTCVLPVRMFITPMVRTLLLPIVT